MATYALDGTVFAASLAGAEGAGCAGRAAVSAMLDSLLSCIQGDGTGNPEVYLHEVEWTKWVRATD